MPMKEADPTASITQNHLRFVWFCNTFQTVPVDWSRISGPAKEQRCMECKVQVALARIWILEVFICLIWAMLCLWFTYVYMLFQVLTGCPIINTVIQTETIFKRSKYSSDKVTIAAKCNKEISLMGCQLHIKISHETMLVHGSPDGGVICDMKNRTRHPDEDGPAAWSKKGRKVPCLGYPGALRVYGTPFSPIRTCSILSEWNLNKNSAQ